MDDKIVKNNEDKKRTLAQVKEDAREVTLRRLRDDKNFKFAKHPDEVYPDISGRAAREARQKARQEKLEKSYERISKQIEDEPKPSQTGASEGYQVKQDARGREYYVNADNKRVSKEEFLGATKSS